MKFELKDTSFHLILIKFNNLQFDNDFVNITYLDMIIKPQKSNQALFRIVKSKRYTFFLIPKLTERYLSAEVVGENLKLG